MERTRLMVLTLIALLTIGLMAWFTSVGQGHPEGAVSGSSNVKSLFACPKPTPWPEPTPCPEAAPCPEPEPCPDEAIACPTLPPTMAPPPPPPTPAPPVDDSLLPRNPPPHDDLADYKIYVYDDPVMAMEGLLDDCGPYAGRPDDDDFPRIHELMLRSPRRTMDPSEASLFFVNIPMFRSFSCPLKNGTKEESAAAHLERMEVAIGALLDQPWWQRYEGEDHLIASHNYRYTARRSTNPISVALQKTLSTVSATLVDRYRNRKCYCKRSIISPYPTHPALTYVNTTFSEWEGRRLTYYYQTRTSISYAPYATMLRHGPVFLPPKLSGHVARGKEEESVWAARWQDAKFCLVIRGDTPTSHAFFNALLSSCIPVIMSDDFVDVGMPFQDKVDIERFAFFVKEDTFLNKGNYAIQQSIRKDYDSLEDKVDYMVNYAVPRLVAAHPNSLVAEMLIDEALERMYGLPPGDTTA